MLAEPAPDMRIRALTSGSTVVADSTGVAQTRPPSTAGRGCARPPASATRAIRLRDAQLRERWRYVIKIDRGCGAATDAAARLFNVEVDDPAAAAAVRTPGQPGPNPDIDHGAELAVGALYQTSALGLIRLAYVMLGDRPSAEDVVQEAFCALYRRWDRLTEVGSAVSYVRSSVLNGCRSVLRHRAAVRRAVVYQRPDASAEAVALGDAEREQVIRAVRALPHRQREAVMLRFYLDLPDEEIARVMGIGCSTVRSTMHRALETLGRVLKETS
jgi:RNA polymerase sigma-70 factor (sigma-E family)